MSPQSFPGAVVPDREYHVDCSGLQIAIHEWGAEDADPIFLVHGGFDFARTYDVFAPMLAAAGWRVVTWDQRGHGDSEHAEIYSWDADVRDAMQVMDHITASPAPVVGHSKGGGLMIQLADAQPYRFTHLVNLDGIPGKRRLPDVSERERTRMMATDIVGWLDHRRTTADNSRKPGTIEQLAERRRAMNPRRSTEWLCYLVTVGGREHADGWRWKIDASMRMGGFGPWRPEWTIARLPGLPMPFLGILGTEEDPMSWGTEVGLVTPFLPRGGRIKSVDGVGHFVHIENPDAVAALVLEFLGLADVTVRTLTHNKVRLALHELRAATAAGQRPLLMLHGLGERSLTAPPGWASWPGAVHALDFTGHGSSTIPRGGGYSAELLLADADAALAALGEATVIGRGVGAYVALMLAGARAQQVRGTILCDGPGLAGGAIGPTSQSFVTLPASSRTPDPYAMFEMSRDVRPPDYATQFVRLAVEHSGLDEPIAVAAVVRPPWLAAVVDEVGVSVTSLERALAGFAKV